ncbi:unnamed protein product [Schistosoma spindalis]|nr:unnamed protein product [Schistosoma spindale]
MLRSRRSAPVQSTNTKEELSTGGLSSVDIGWVGPITLRRRAKPELENEQHKDVSLRISIQEVKNLSAKGRYFCEICLDRTLYARTTSKLSDGTVFWGEQFDLNNLPIISIMTINLFRQATSVKDKRQKNKNQNQFIGYVTIPLNDDSEQCEIQKWFTMQPPQINSNLNYLENLQVRHQQQTDTNQNPSTNSSNGVSGRFRKHSIPASCFGYSNSFSIIPNSQYTTNSNNKLNDDNELKYNHMELSKKKCSWTAGVSTDSNFNKNNKIIPKSSSSTSTATSPNLSPNSNSVTNNFILPENSLPQLRMMIHYQTVDILPIACYNELKEFIKTKYLDLIRNLELKLSAKQKEELTSCFVNIFEKLPDLSVAEFLSVLLREDLSNNGKESMIFRANSAGSKAMECYIKLVGTDYLRYTLGPVIDQLLVIGDDFEIDPSRLGASNDSSTALNNRNTLSAILERNRTALLKNVAMIWQRIESSQCKLPKELRDVFTALALTIEETHGVQSAAHLISSCLFLRFICPAIHGPVLFGLASSIPENNRISRNLTLIAKVLQNLANLTLFEDKEIHMKALNSFIEPEIPTMYKFLRSIASNTDSNYHLSTNSDCHEFIELGYEFAKLTQLLNLYVNKINITPQIAELPDLLQNISELLNNQTFTSWNHKSQTSFERNTNSNSHSSRSAIPRHHSLSNNNPISGVDNRRQSEATTIIKPSLTKLHVDRKLSSEAPINVKPIHNQQEPSNNANSNSSADSNEFISNIKQKKSWDTFIIQKEYLPCKFNSADMIFKQIHINDLEQSENMEELLSQYREQLRQLNDCIEKVGPNCCHNPNLSHALSHSTQSVHKIKNPSNRIPNNNGNNNHINNGRSDRNLSRQSTDENSYRQMKRKIINSKSDNSTPIPLDSLLKKTQCPYQNSDNKTNNNSISKDDDDDDGDEGDDNYTSECDIGRTLVPTHSASITIDRSSTSDSDYDYDDCDDRITECTTEDTSEYVKKTTTKNNKPRRISARQNHLSESPSLDQLAEKLQELKKMLQLERQEIEEVVASKTEVIKQQEKSIEQLESELDQLRKDHRPLKMKPPNGRHTSKSTSRTVSPTSSLSSECYSSNLSDTTQNCHSYNNPFYHNDIHNNNNNNNHFFDSSVTNYHSNNQGLNNLSRGEPINTENYRTENFQEKILWRGQMSRCEPQIRCDSNLLYLSRASEGTGIPLGHLIGANRSAHIGRRESETKLLPH